MPAYAVLLKGVNVGRAKRIGMPELRDVLTGMGLRNVRTVLQSGNAVFTTARTDPAEIADLIEHAIADKFGMTVRCLVRTAAELRAVVNGHPLADLVTNGSRMLVLFLSEALSTQALAVDDPVTLDPHRIRVGADRVIYQWCPDGISNAPDASSYLEKAHKITVTGRNWNTVVKLDTLLAGLS
jgi:uncharacterized protein (DUF1697 family)